VPKRPKRPKRVSEAEAQEDAAAAKAAPRGREETTNRNREKKRKRDPVAPDGMHSQYYCSSPLRSQFLAHPKLKKIGGGLM
jgi:hypothetical protein